MSANAWIRNGLILAGIAVGGALVATAAMRPHQTQSPADSPGESNEPVSVVLNTSNPAQAPLVALARPLSLDSAFGRSEVSGLQVVRVPQDPMHELGIDRQFDIAAGSAPPRLSLDLPARRADDEISPGEDDRLARIAANGEESLADLPGDARQAALAGRRELVAGNQKLDEALAIMRGSRDARGVEQTDKLFAEAARHYEAARENFTQALEIAPVHAALLAFMQETKANLYTSRKHSMGRG